MECVLVIKNVSVKLFSFYNGGCIGDQECLSNFCKSLPRFFNVIKNVSFKHFSYFNGGSKGDQQGVCQTLIGDQERVCQTLQLLQWSVYWWSRTCLSNSSASSMEGVLVSRIFSASLMEGVSAIKKVSGKLFSFFNGGSIGVHEHVCQAIQLL